MGAAVEKYTQIDPAFKRKNRQLQDENTRTLGKLLHNAIDKDKAIEEFGKAVLEE